MFKIHPDPAERLERLLPALEDQLGQSTDTVDAKRHPELAVYPTDK